MTVIGRCKGIYRAMIDWVVEGARGSCSSDKARRS